MDKSKVEKLYNKVLNDYIIPIVGNKTTYMTDLLKTGKEIFGDKFIGVFPSDRIPQMYNNQMCILNLDKSNEPGSHWISIYSYNNKLIVYDSFGRKSSKIIKSLSGFNKNIIDTEYDAEQKPHETNCGARSLTALCLMNTHNPLEIAKFL